MAWTNYRAIIKRFSHIDAAFVSASAALSPDSGHADVVVRFYPWWEHPGYLAARARDAEWDLSSSEAGKRDVRVRAVNPWAVRLTPRSEVTDWEFCEEHPLLWHFADSSIVYANAPFDRRALFAGLLALQLPNVTELDLLTHVHLPPTDVTPLGMTVPAQLHAPVVSVFHDLGIPVFSPGLPQPPAPAVVLWIDSDDYIIAEDFEVDVPEFVHDDAWFQPRARL